MKAKQIVVGQNVKPIKQELAKKLRREMTHAEKRLWFYLRDKKLHGLHFRRQQVIDGFIVDFYCHAAGVVVEADGGIHERHKEYDAERDRIIASRGIKVVRFRNDEIENDIYHVIKRILQVCESSKRSQNKINGRKAEE